MGADLITAVLVKPHGKELDWEAAHAVIDTMVADDFDAQFVWAFGFEDVMGSVAVEDLRDTAHQAFLDVQNAHENSYRHLNVYADMYGIGLDVLVVGGTSWGDSPDGLDAFIGVSACREAAEAAGFLFDLREWSRD